MIETMEDGIRAASKAGLIDPDNEQLVHPEGFLTPRCQPCRRQRDSLDGGVLAAHKGRNGNSDGEGDSGCPPDSDGSDDTEMEAILQEFIETLMRLLEPRYAEVVWRAEILNHPPTRIATDLGLSEQIVIRRLQLGRRTLLHFVMLTLEPPLKV